MKLIFYLLFIVCLLVIYRRKSGSVIGTSTTNNNLYNTHYNMAYKCRIIEENDEMIVVYASNDKSEYMAKLKLKVIMILHEGTSKKYGYLNYRNKRMRIDLIADDEVRIKQMLVNMCTIAEMEDYDSVRFKCSIERCHSCYKREVCKNH